MQNDPAYAGEALGADARGYVLKQAAGVELLQAIRMTVGGATYLNPELDARVAAEAPERQGPPGDLTEREAEVPRLVALGHTNNEIAGQLYPNVRTRTDSRSSSKTSPHPTSRRRESSRSPSSPYVPREG